MNEEQTNLNPENNTQQPTERIGNTVVADQQPETPKVKNHKKTILAVILLGLILTGGSTAYFLLNSNTEPVNNAISENLKVTDQQITEDPDEPVTLSDLPGVAGIIFNVPDKWTVQETINTDDPAYNSYQLLSPDVTNMLDGYIGISGGYSLSIRNQDRNIAKEKEFDEPWKSYVSTIGAPKLGTEEESDSKTDYTKIKKLTNPKDIVLHYYKWAYEGCFIDFIALSETKVLNFSITSGDGNCPQESLVEENSDISSFIKSLEFGESKLISADAYVKQTMTKNTEGYTVQSSTNVLTKNVKFNYNSGLFSMIGVPILKPDGTLKILNSGESAEAIRQQFGDNCPQCGFTQRTYDETIEYIEEAPIISGFTELKNGVYGKASSDVTPASKGNKVKLYQYIKQIMDKSYFLIRFIKESSEDEYTSKLPAVDSEDILKLIDSIVIVE